MYGYANGDPITYSDPFGLWPPGKGKLLALMWAAGAQINDYVHRIGNPHPSDALPNAQQMEKTLQALETDQIGVASEEQKTRAPRQKLRAARYPGKGTRSAKRLVKASKIGGKFLGIAGLVLELAFPPEANASEADWIEAGRAKRAARSEETNRTGTPAQQ